MLIGIAIFNLKKKNLNYSKRAFCMTRLIIVGLVFLPSLLACSKVENQPYSHTLVSEYINNCVANGHPFNSCACVINELPKYLSQKEYLELKASYMATGQFSDNMMDAMDKVMRTCPHPS